MPVSKTQLKLFSVPFTDSDVKWRVGRTSKDGKSVALLAYVDARTVCAKLDEIVGIENWKVEYTPLGDDGSVLCHLSINIEDVGWVTKTDIGSPSNVEPTKGAVSDAIKRASVVWGLGRHLYDLPDVWVKTIAVKKNERAVYVKGQYAHPPTIASLQPLTDEQEIVRFENAIRKEFGITLKEAGEKAKEMGMKLDDRKSRVEFYQALRSA